ncbi:MAG: molybdopterin-guanine dinucleotide biosynthesis protein MobB [Rhodopirellula sp.]|mgnify:CR=1 FL=1|nr:molybdopterin-guanine dinucleotide biosynthesis protein MobB [Rhodopirellula sp.]
MLNRYSAALALFAFAFGWAAAADSPEKPVGYRVELTAAHHGFDGTDCWVHARAGAIPPGIPANAGSTPLVVMTMQKLLLTGSDVFYPLHTLWTGDLGKTWSKPRPESVFARREMNNGVEMTVCDFWPQWHQASGKLLGTGHTVWYQDNRVMHVRKRHTAYAVYDTTARSWLPWKELEMPDDARFENAGAGCTQRHDLPGGDILLPIYFKRPEDKCSATTVVRCRFDGEKLSYVEHGSELTTNVPRGFGEPSLAKCGKRFFLTLRNDVTGYVTSGPDGLHFDAPKVWTFDDGTELGSYNTQQHWVVHNKAIFLVYTRRGANNDHVFRHRAPLLMAQVDPQRLCVIRSTERVLVPERGARLGNFGVTDVLPGETWVTAAEWMQTWGPNYVMTVDNPGGADNAIWVAKIKWDEPNGSVE